MAIGLVITTNYFGYEQVVIPPEPVTLPTASQPVHAVARADSANFSTPGEFISRLQDLQTANPDRFKSVVTEVAAQLQSAAPTFPAPLNSFLSDLSSAFQNVAATGDLSQLAASLQSQASTYDPQGKVAASAAASPIPITPADISTLFIGITQDVSQAVQAK